jgi:hypothetical protein
MFPQEISSYLKKNKKINFRKGIFIIYIIINNIQKFKYITLSASLMKWYIVLWKLQKDNRFSISLSWNYDKISFSRNDYHQKFQKKIIHKFTRIKNHLTINQPAEEQTIHMINFHKRKKEKKKLIWKIIHLIQFYYTNKFYKTYCLDNFCTTYSILCIIKHILYRFFNIFLLNIHFI